MSQCEVAADTNKIEVVKNLTTPRRAQKVKFWISFVECYQHVCPDFSTIVIPECSEQQIDAEENDREPSLATADAADKSTGVDLPKLNQTVFN